MNKSSLKRAIDQGRGTSPADLVLRNGRFFDLVSGELLSGDIAICEERIVGTCESYRGETEIDISGQIVVPGFIDTHLHVESSCVTPFEFDRCVTPLGVTTAICDPHEIANVAGIPGIQYFLDAAMNTVLDLRVQLSSCVPSTSMETAGANLPISALLPFAGHQKVIGLAEFMNYPGVLHGDDACLDKLEQFQGGHIDGHAPLLRGLDLNAYLAAGISTDHETTTESEALEKLRKGMHVLIREGSVSKDLDALLPVINERNSPFIALCTDDRNPLDIAEQGHLDYMIRHAISRGAEPLAVYRAASISAARAFGFNDRGLVAPGWRADLVVLDSLESCRAREVICGGRPVNDALFESRQTVPPIALNSVKPPVLNSNSFHTPSNSSETHIIGIEPGKIITQHLIEDMPIAHGGKQADPARDLAKIAIVERHGRNGNIASGFVRGFEIRRGAIGSTVCHDHHNIAVVGINDQDMILAAERLGEIGGGFNVVLDGKVITEVALPIGGLMSLKSYEEVRDELVELRAAAASLGITLEEPFLQLAFLALPVIPHLKITDHGLVDVDRFEVIA